MFMADAEQLRALIGETEPLTDDRPKRLGNGRHSPQAARIVYRPWTDAALTRERFRTSGFIRSAWPDAVRERTLDYFPFQGAINDIAAKRQFTLGAWIQRLHEILTRSDLETLVIWQLGETSDRQAAVERLVAKGKPRGRYRRSLAKRAFAERDYESAARLLATRPGRPIRSVTQLSLQLYALCMAGKVAEAERVARDRQQWLPDDADGRAYLAWLRATFGFEPPARGAAASPLR
jgi:hypothetical protein